MDRPMYLRRIDLGRRVLNEDEAALFERLLEEGLVNEDNFEHFLTDPRPYFRSQGYLVKVGFEVPFELQILAGNYAVVDPRINIDSFPLAGKGVTNCKLRLVKPNFTATTAEVRTEIESRGFIPASIEHLLAFGARFGEVQRQFAVAALGNLRNGLVPLLSVAGDPPVRSLELLSESSVWDPECRFLVVEIERFCGILP